jgi:hypothetical protein
MTQVNVIMGIFQEDYTITGQRAEQAALRMIRLFSILNHDENKPFKRMRITNGAVRKEENVSQLKIDYGQHFILYGKRDHAGATGLDDRYDPAVAAAKLLEAFYRITDRFKQEQAIELEPLVGDLNLYAKYTQDIKINAKARNAIADVATLSLAIRGRDVSNEIGLKIFELLRDELNANTKMYGQFEKKDLYHWESIEVDTITICQKLSLTLDVRYADEQIMDSFLSEKEEMINAVRQEFEVHIQNSLEQQLAPLHLDKEKNVSLILDGSIGGSHNPHEAEYPEVVLAGTILQLTATLKFMKNPQRKIFDVVEESLPRMWREKIRNFYSGALHDACQIATGISRRNGYQTNI